MAKVKVVNEQYEINGNTTVCYLTVGLSGYAKKKRGWDSVYDDLRTLCLEATGTVVCQDDDVYNEELGKQLAFTKAIMRAKAKWIIYITNQMEMLGAEHDNLLDALFDISDSRVASENYNDMLLTKVETKDDE